jgi:hypothetical protein
MRPANQPINSCISAVRLQGPGALRGVPAVLRKVAACHHTQLRCQRLEEEALLHPPRGF